MSCICTKYPVFKQGIITNQRIFNKSVARFCSKSTSTHDDNTEMFYDNDDAVFEDFDILYPIDENLYISNMQYYLND